MGWPARCHCAAISFSALVRLAAANTRTGSSARTPSPACACGATSRASSTRRRKKVFMSARLNGTDHNSAPPAAQATITRCAGVRSPSRCRAPSAVRTPVRAATSCAPCVARRQAGRPASATSPATSVATGMPSRYSTRAPARRGTLVAGAARCRRRLSGSSADSADQCAVVRALAHLAQQRRSPRAARTVRPTGRR